MGGITAVTGSLTYGRLNVLVVGQPVDLIAHQIIINASAYICSALSINEDRAIDIR